MEDINGVDNNLELVDGPFGFGYAIQLKPELLQCQTKRGNADGENCIHDPSTCTHGLSISIWEKTSFTLEKFYGADTAHQFPAAYLISTGGDTMGHPGVALYHQGILLVGLVSTGDKYWMSKSPGSVANNTWFNIGIRWDQTDGLEVLVNDRRVSYQAEGRDSTRKDALDPPEIMLGCHKHADAQDYGHFLEASLDELAIWHRRLRDENTIYFLGGYEGEIENIDASEYEKMLSKTDLKNDLQHTVALSILAEMTAPSLAKVQETGNLTEEQEEAEAEQFQTIVRMFNKLAHPENVPTCTSAENMNRMQMMADLTSNMLASEKASNWLHSEKEGDGGALGLTHTLDGYLKALAKSLHCNKGSQLSFSATTPRLHIQMNKLPANIFRSTGRFEVPNYTGQSELRKTWGHPSQTIEVPTILFSDSRCQRRKVNVITTLYNNLDTVLVKPVKINPKTLNAKVENVLDSHVAGVDIVSDQELLPSGQVNPRFPSCLPDPEKLNRNIVKFTLLHKDQKVTLRRLLFHEGEVESDLYTRHCVWWNREIGQDGAWDRQSCRVVESTTYHTKCTCKRLAKYAILAEKVEPVAVPDEVGWLTTTRYILYGISALCLVVYIVVVAIAGDLKEQFHLLGMALAVLVLGGSLCIVLTDLDSVRDKRHLCTALGTLVHSFYLCAGACVAMLGHATFKCITAGIIGGSLRQYGYLSVGVTLVSVGCTYTFFMHDLGTDPRCFISWYNEPKIFFFFPHLMCCGVAAFCAFVIFFNLRTAALRSNPAVVDYRSFSVGAAILFLYFSLTWVVGGVAYLRRDLGVDLYPFFQILNSLVGVVLLACIGVGSSRFRMVVAGQAKRRREMFMSYRRRNSGDDLHHPQQQVVPDHHHPKLPESPAYIRPNTTQQPSSPSMGRPRSSNSLFSYY
ncbi:adhesion G-protein coupled receptor D1-like [Panulirus ornatus]|uniref:adhesion G-protein coupled receptor D1-like n=1 Tax=Panulirus ornatus TaxID=150431 RepID=UPI003A846028